MNNIEKIWISRLNIKNSFKMKLISKFGGIHNFYTASLDDLVDLNLNDDVIKKIHDIKLREKCFKDNEYVLKNNIDVLCVEDNEYPFKLKEIEDMPIVIYLKGNKNILNDDSIGIVGSRNAKRESLEISRKIANIFACNSINVISGLARGIDKYAHLGALDSGGIGKTIGVLGTGIDNESIYPYENKKVVERMLEQGGTILSEYPIGTRPLPYNFPYRNRIISGLSGKIFLIQASKNSGSLITVEYAIEQGKEVYVYQNEKLNTGEFEGNRILIENISKFL